MDFKITCGFCGKSNDMDLWIEKQKKETYKCPSCHRTIKREIGKGTILNNGFFMPGKIKIIEDTPQCGVNGEELE